MAKKETFTSEELERQADALLSAAGQTNKDSRTPEGAKAAPVMTDEEARKAGIIRLDDQTGGRAARRLMADQ